MNADIIKELDKQGIITGLNSSLFIDSIFLSVTKRKHNGLDPILIRRCWMVEQEQTSEEQKERGNDTLLFFCTYQYFQNRRGKTVTKNRQFTSVPLEHDAACKLVLKLREHCNCEKDINKYTMLIKKLSNWELKK